MNLDFKFNNGLGALLCTCGSILATGFEHDNQILCCSRPECCKKWSIRAPKEEGIGFVGLLIG